MAEEGDVGAAAGGGEEQRPYEVTYLREDGNEVSEIIWAVNHGEAVKVAEKHGLDILFRVRRETAHGRKNGGAHQSAALPFVVAAVLVVGVVGLILWRCRAFHF